MTTHANSLSAYHEGHETGAIPNRAQEVLQAVRTIGRATDRQVRDALGFDDMNAVRPRITELVKRGTLREIGDAVDPITNKRVRVVSIAD